MRQDLTIVLNWFKYFKDNDLCFEIMLRSEHWLVPLFNDISIFMGYLMPMPFSKEDSSGTI